MKTGTIPAQPRPKSILLGKTNHSEEMNKKILSLLSQDKRPKEIAKELFVSIWTVRRSIHRMVKLNGYKSITALIADAIREKVIC